MKLFVPRLTGEGGGLRWDRRSLARNEARPKYDRTRPEGLTGPGFARAKGATQGRGQPSVGDEGSDAAGGFGTIARAGDDGRSDATVAMGLQEPRQAGDGASRDGSQSQLLEHSQLLGELKYCRHSNRKTKEGGKHRDRDAQFEYINAKIESFQAEDQPVISIDAKKKELLGEFKNGGSDYSPQAGRSRSTPTISRTRNWANAPPTGSTTPAPTTATSALESTMIPGNSPSTAFGSGSIGSAGRVISG